MPEHLQDSFAVSEHTWELAAKEAFGGFLARLVWKGPAEAHEPLTKELDKPGE